MRGFLLSFLALCGFFQYGSTITCYECNSANIVACNDAVLPDSLKRNCSDHDRGVTHTLCRKIIQHLDYEVNGHMPSSRIIRTCGWDDSKYKGACYHRAGYGGRQEVCSCTTDLCNSSHQLLTPGGLVIITIVMNLKKMLRE